MPFFSNLADRISGYTLQLTITRDGDKMTVMVYPKVSEKDEVQKMITPLTMTGTPTELDQEFFSHLGTQLDKTKDFASQIKNYEKGLTKATETAAKGSKTSTSDAGKTDKPKDETKTTQTNLDLGKKDTEKKEPQEDVPDNVDQDTGEIESERAGTDEPVAAAAADDEVTADSPESESDETPDNGVADDSGQASEGQAPEENPDEDW